MSKNKIEIAIIGGGPGGLMAAETLAQAGLSVTIYERKPSVGRKFLVAGNGGLNITHFEDLETFISRYGAAAEKLRPAIENFPPLALRKWCEELGEETFVGSSGKVFPKSFKAINLLNAWIEKLEKLNVKFVFNHQWLGWGADGELAFSTPEGIVEKTRPTATILSLGGASWPQLGSDGSWVEILQQQGVPISPLRPANCGFVTAWSDIFRDRFAGQPLKTITLSFAKKTIRGEIMITDKGIEGGAVYALSAPIRDAIEKTGYAEITLDLRPDVSLQKLTEQLDRPRKSLSFSSFLHKAGLSQVTIGIIREVGGENIKNLDASKLAALIKSLPLKLTKTTSIETAISTAGGIKLDAVDEYFMLKNKPGVFAVGEMLDWEVQTGGYLLQATFSTAVYASKGVLQWTEKL